MSWWAMIGLVLAFFEGGINVVLYGVFLRVTKFEIVCECDIAKE